MDEGQPGAPFLEARGVSMSFPGVRALDAVDFDVRAGEVHAVVGENGAGKSTLIRVLSGELSAYEGEVRMGGRPVRFRSPRDGIAMSLSRLNRFRIEVWDILARIKSSDSSLAASIKISLLRCPRSS